LFDQDHENKVYSFDIRDKYDFDAVASIMMDKQREGYVARGFDKNTGNYIEFNSYSGMLNFSEVLGRKASLDDVLTWTNSFVALLSNAVSAGYLYSALDLSETGKYSSFRYMKDFDRLGKPFGQLSMAKSGGSAVINFSKKDYYGIAENLYDLGVSAIGYFGGGCGMCNCIRIGLF